MIDKLPLLQKGDKSGVNKTARSISLMNHLIKRSQKDVIIISPANSVGNATYFETETECTFDFSNLTVGVQVPVTGILNGAAATGTALFIADPVPL